MRVILEVLVVGIAMNGQQHGFFDPDLAVHNGSDRSDAVGGTGSVTDDRNGVKLIFGDSFGLVHAENRSGDAFAFGGSRENDGLGTANEMLFGQIEARKGTGRLNDDIGSIGLPRNLGRVTLCQNGDFEGISLGLDVKIANKR